MELPTHFLVTYGYLLLFLWVFVEQLGIPVPAAPVLLAAGALSAQRELGFLPAYGAALVACLISDTTWFFIGRRYGHLVLTGLCRLSMEPMACVQRTRSSFKRTQKKTLLYAKFIPGLAILAAPVAGQSGISLASFLLYDMIGAALWVGALLVGGRVFGDALRRDPSLLAWVERFSGALLVLGIIAFFILRMVRRRRLLRKFAESRLDPTELKELLEAGEPVYIVDLRHPLELVPDPFVLPGALHIAPDDLAAQAHQIPRDRDVILYCTCPNEATAAHTALRLHKLGVQRVRPLRGGYDEWKKLGFPLQAIPPVIPPTDTLVQIIN
jgi:membrane protein DedA with SNARE-associated domain/rhodanese-related sulfurtransferase